MSNKASKIEISEVLAALLAQIEPYQAYLFGNRLASIIAIKGYKGQAEAAGQAPFFGPDGMALESAFAALGWGDNSWCGVLLEPVGQPALTAAQLRLLIEIIDPQAIVALDKIAIDLVQECFEPDIPSIKLMVGKKIDILGRLFVGLDGFEAALANQELKQKAWIQLKVLKK
jgi:hypothetical protein